ncbi:MAG: hypothetical protein V1913_06835 [Fibrobacterota bacterium]
MVNGLGWANHPLRTIAALLISVGVLAGCLPGSEQRIRGKLDRLLESDQAAITLEISARDPAALLERPYYRITGYRPTPQSGSYSHLCAVTFYYFKMIKMKQIRKYRYNPDTGEWERYWKEVRYNLAGKG